MVTTRSYTSSRHRKLVSGPLSVWDSYYEVVEVSLTLLRQETIEIDRPRLQIYGMTYIWRVFWSSRPDNTSRCDVTASFTCHGSSQKRSSSLPKIAMFQLNLDILKPLRIGKNFEEIFVLTQSPEKLIKNRYLNLCHLHFKWSERNLKPNKVSFSQQKNTLQLLKFVFSL